MIGSKRIQSMVRNERGAVIALVAVSLVVLLGIAGLALDAGRGYLVKAEFARAVDAGVLAGARALRQGQSYATQRALEVAALNGIVSGQGGATLTVSFGANEFGEQTITMQASREVDTFLLGALGLDEFSVAASASAAVPPVDLVLVLDQSGSLDRNHAWGDLQDAAKEFVDNFDDDIDQMSLTSFQLRGTGRHALSGDFTATVKQQIDAMRSDGDTNAGEGLRLAYNELTGPEVRERSAKVVVFFTDGRPTAFRGNIGGQDRMMAVYTTNSGVVRGYFNDPDNLPTDRVANPSGCQDQSSCLGWDEGEVRGQARQSGLDRAAELRGEGFYVYSIGLGDPGAADPLEVPDMDYLRQIANEEGIASAGQPKGKAYFAPSRSELHAVFNEVAQDLLVRLAH